MDFLLVNFVSSKSRLAVNGGLLASGCQGGQCSIQRAVVFWRKQLIIVGYFVECYLVVIPVFHDTFISLGNISEGRDETTNKMVALHKNWKLLFGYSNCSSSIILGVITWEIYPCIGSLLNLWNRIKITSMLRSFRWTGSGCLSIRTLVLLLVAA